MTRIIGYSTHLCVGVRPLFLLKVGRDYFAYCFSGREWGQEFSILAGKLAGCYQRCFVCYFGLGPPWSQLLVPSLFFLLILTCIYYVCIVHILLNAVLCFGHPCVARSSYCRFGQSYYFQLDNPTELNHAVWPNPRLGRNTLPYLFVSLSLLHCFVMLAHVHIVLSCVVFMWHDFCNSVLVLYVPPWSWRNTVTFHYELYHLYVVQITIKAVTKLLN